MVKEIRKKTNKAICAILSMAMLFSSSGLTSVSAAETAEQETMAEALTSELEEGSEEASISEETAAKSESEEEKEEVEASEEEASNADTAESNLSEASEAESETEEAGTQETETEALTEDAELNLEAAEADFEYDSTKGIITKYNGSAAELVIPDRINGIGVTGIGQSAFINNEKLISVVIPDTATTIDNYAFKSCTALSDVKLPKSLKSMGTAAFSGCSSLQKIEIPAGLEKCASYNGSVFSGAGLKEVSFEEGITKIAGHLFQDCAAIEELDIPDTVMVIEEAAFQSCSNLKRVGISQNTPITQIQKNAFAWCSQLSAIELPDSVTRIGEYAFKNCISLTDIKLSKSLRSMGTAAFLGCGRLERIEIPASLEECASYDGSVFSGTGLKEVSFEEGITKIADHLFQGCVAIEELDIPDTIMVIEEAAFQSCPNLKRVGISQNTPITQIQKNAFAGCSQLPAIELPDSVTRIGEYAFKSCIKLTDVRLPKSLRSMGTAAFLGCDRLERIEIPASLEGCESYDGSVFSGTGLKEVSFEEGTIRIADHLFQDCAVIEEIAIPDTVTVIEEAAFQSCPNLKRVGISQNTPITQIQKNAFAGCSQLSAIELPDSVTRIGEYAFKSCIKLTDVKLPKSLESMGTAAFLGCSRLKRIEIPASLEGCESYDGSVFSGTGLKEVSFEEGTAKIADHLFMNCAVIETIEIPNTVTVIEEAAFENCSNLKNVTLHRPLTEIQKRAFLGCSQLREITIPRSVVKIADNVFSNSTALTIYGVSGTYVEEYAEKIGAKFAGCSIPAEQVSIDPAELTLSNGEKAKISISVTPSDFTDNVTWESSDEAAAEVDNEGNVTAKKTGKAAITVTVGAVSAVCEVTVVNAVKNVEKIELDKAAVSLNVSQTAQLTAIVFPEDADNKAIAWSSSDEKIAQVDENGLVTAVSEGSTAITAAAQDGSGVSGECKVTVVKSGADTEEAIKVPIYNTIILNTNAAYIDKTINAALDGMQDNTAEVLAVEGLNKNSIKAKDNFIIEADGGNLKVGINKKAGAVKKGTYKFNVKAAKKNGGEATGILMIKAVSALPSVTYKKTGSIEALDREHTQLKLKPSIKNYTDSIRAVTLSGVGEGLFSAVYDNNENIIIVKADKTAALELKRAYKPTLKLTLASGAVLEKTISISVKQTNPGIEKTSVIPVTNSVSGTVTLKPKKAYAQIADVSLVKEDKTFICKNEGNGKITIQVKDNPEKKPIAGKKYSLKLNVTFADSAANAKPINVTVKMQYNSPN